MIRVLVVAFNQAGCSSKNLFFENFDQIFHFNA